MAPDTEQPVSVTFHCSVCGECCSGMTIPVSAEKTDVLMTKPWVRDRLREFNRSLVRIDNDFFRMPLRDDQYCVFLGDDKRCLIEVNEGSALKPDECKRFPFARTDAPNGNPAYDVSASCKTVAEELIPKFLPIIPAAGQEPSPQQPHLPARIKVSGNKTIDQETYNRYCNRLWQLFAEAETPALALRQTRTLLNALPNDAMTRPCDAAFSNFWQRFLPVWLLRKPYGIMSTIELLRGEEYHDAKIFGVPVNLKNLNAIAVDSSAQHLLRGFLANILNRRVLLTYGHSLETMLSMACASAILAAWYARVFAQAQDLRTAGKAEMSFAIRIVERYYTGHQPQFPEKFRRHWLLKTLCLRVFTG